VLKVRLGRAATHVEWVIVEENWMDKRFALVAACAWLTACSHMSLRTPAATTAVAPTKGNQAAGTVNFVQRGSIVYVDARITGLSPGLHGFHVHEKGDCRGDGGNAGGHFNPTGAQHAGPDGNARHAGDLGNLNADSSGLAVYHAQVSGISLGTGSDSIIGRALIVHANVDDLRSQPAGNAGGRVACGLISKSADQWF
jgi:superoxide dismutase, Cu-Zn family